MRMHICVFILIVYVYIHLHASDNTVSRPVCKYIDTDTVTVSTCQSDVQHEQSLLQLALLAVIVHS